MKKILLQVLLGILWAPLARSQDSSMYEQASETSGLVVQYTNDARAVNYFYGASAGGFRSLANSPDQRDRMMTLNREYLQKLANTNYTGISIDGQAALMLA